jgi:hypothetical protein
MSGNIISREHLDIVRDCAKRVACDIAWPNEMAVFEHVEQTHGAVFGETVLRILKFCAEEVAHQLAGALAVSCYFDAWHHAVARYESGYALDLTTLNELAALIEPLENVGGRYRCSTVSISGMSAGTPPDLIERGMMELEAGLIAYQEGERVDFYGRPMNPQLLYTAFQEIHPRKNGNGREGKIIYNWLMDLLNEPIFPEYPFAAV